MLNIIKKALIVVVMFNVCSANAIYNKKFFKKTTRGTIYELVAKFKKATNLNKIPAIIDDCHVLSVSATNQFNTKTIELVNSKKPLLKISYTYDFKYDNNDIWNYTFITKCSEKNGTSKIVIYLY